MRNTPHRYFTFAVPVHAPHFDNPALRWSTFVGEFLAPIVRDRAVDAFLFLNHEMANYELRFAAADYKSLEARLRLRAQRMGIQINGNPTDGETIGQTYAENRFIAQIRLGDADAAARRSVLVFRAMHAACELYLDNLIPQGNYWQIEANGQQQHNPRGNMFESMIHLYSNMSGTDFDVFIAPTPPAGTVIFTRGMSAACAVTDLPVLQSPAAPAHNNGGHAVCKL